MFAWTGQVTQGKLGTRVARSPAATSFDRWGIAARSCERRPGTERSTIWSGMGSRHHGVLGMTSSAVFIGKAEAILYKPFHRRMVEPDRRLIYSRHQPARRALAF